MAEALLSPEVLKAVDEVDGALKKVEDHVRILLPNCTRGDLEKLTSVERATIFLTLSKTLNALFCLYLKTNGLSPEDHPSKSEMERVDLYGDKVQKAVDKSTAPRRPTSTVDVLAANRFIDHAISDLSQEQRKQLRDVGKKGAPKRHHERVTTILTPKKRPSGLSIAEEAAAFLAEASLQIKMKSEGKSVDKSD